MDDLSPRAVLERLVVEHRANYGALSKLIGRNSAYIQQFIKRGTPRKLDEGDRRILADYFGVDEALLGGLPSPTDDKNTSVNLTEGYENKDVAFVSQLELEASAGAGAVVSEEEKGGVVGFDRWWLHRRGLDAQNLSIIEVKGESMAPALHSGDTIMVDRGDAASRLRGGIYVLRIDDMLMAKRIVISHVDSRQCVDIVSDNPEYPCWYDINMSQVDIIGRVVWTAHLMR